MSKKSRKRNKRLLMMAALAGGAALAGRNKRIRATDSPGNEFAKARATMTDLPDYNPPKAVTGVIKPTAPVDTTPELNVTGGIHADKPAKGMLIKARNKNRITGVDGPPSILNPYRAPVQPKGRLWSNVSYAKGGRVKGCGIAKRGLGRALKGGK